MVSLVLLMSTNGMAAPALGPSSAGLRLDLRTDVGWEMAYFRYMGADYGEALLAQAGQDIGLTILTHKIVPHHCMFNFSHEYCDDSGYPDTWQRAVEPVVCSGITAASRALLSGDHARAEQLCVTFRGGFSSPASGAHTAPDLASDYLAHIGQPESGDDPMTVELTVTLTLDREQPLQRLSPGCYGSVCVGDTLSSAQATSKAPLDIIAGQGSCGRVRSAMWPAGLSAQFRNNRITRWEVTPPSDIRTHSNVALGESLPLYALYEGVLEETSEAGPGVSPIKAVYWQVRGKKGLQYTLNSDRQIIAMASGGEALMEDWPCQ